MVAFTRSATKGRAGAIILLMSISKSLCRLLVPISIVSLITMDVRAAADLEIERLARIWHDGWHDAHTDIVPAQLVSLRTIESFAERLRFAVADVRVCGPFGDPVGFYIIKDDELYQFYVVAQARGTGVASALMADAEARLCQRGVETAWLACAIGNERAARFYEKCRWDRTGIVLVDLETSQGTFPFQVWRYEKLLSVRSAAD